MSVCIVYNHVCICIWMYMTVPVCSHAYRGFKTDFRTLSIFLPNLYTEKESLTEPRAT